MWIATAQDLECIYLNASHSHRAFGMWCKKNGANQMTVGTVQRALWSRGLIRRRTDRPRSLMTML